MQEVAVTEPYSIGARALALLQVLTERDYSQVDAFVELLLLRVDVSQTVDSVQVTRLEAQCFLQVRLSLS